MSRTVLILGGDGMLGHKLVQALRRHFNVTCTIRGARRGSVLEGSELARGAVIVDGVDALRFDAVQGVLNDVRPNIVVNCIGAIKQRAIASLPIPSITLNALFPHRLAEAAATIGARVIHFSTDCVFSGKAGNYVEEDISDAQDLYGRTKYLGEVAAPNAITLRTSIIGRELKGHTSLLDWFLSKNHSRVPGFTRHFYSGVTTNHMTEIVADVINNHEALSGLYQVTSPRITKHELLCLIRDRFELDIEIVPDSTTFCDRSMVGDRFDRMVKRSPPTWQALVEQLSADPTPYVQGAST